MMNKRYTLEEANELLPTIKQELRQLQRMAEELEDHYTAYRKVKVIYQDGQGDALFEMESRLDFMQMELNLYIENFSRKGVLIKMIHPGLVDFPAILDGEEVLLCWQEGEPHITHYHSWTEGFMGRKPHPEA
ncbi:DUF2203 domain-containing protein [Paenibacillus paeoniae]|uniref:DUF2203 family protein n=1 Tax=Paenibacillus paeoniae TaxID=2292705 RepID=A0A371P651_9BACL|nr:DUF2203 domain-containing protein [Paenibacillus paeoniae]REK71345.1 DUF2203 family protein [Paenibacillus paeoniae]